MIDIDLVKNLDSKEKGRQIIVGHGLDAIWQFACHGQTEPDGKNCAICGDTDHQAMECKFNGFKCWSAKIT